MGVSKKAGWLRTQQSSDYIFSLKISNVDFMIVPPKKAGHQTSFVIPSRVLEKPGEKCPIHIICELLVGSPRMLLNAKIKTETI